MLNSKDEAIAKARGVKTLPEPDEAVMQVVRELETMLQVKFKAKQWNPTTAMMGMAVVGGRLAIAGARTMTMIRNGEVTHAEAPKTPAASPAAGT